MKQRVLTGLIFMLVIAAFIIPGFWISWPPLVLLALVGASICHELLDALRTCGFRPVRLLTYTGLLLILVPLAGNLLFLPQSGVLRTWATLGLFSAALIAWLVLILLEPILRDGPERLADGIVSAATLLYIVFPLGSAVIILTQFTNGIIWLIIGLTAPWISDVLAYFTGVLLGRHKIVPTISPKKTWEGFAGGLLGGVLLVFLAFCLFPTALAVRGNGLSGNWLFIVAAGLLLSISSQLGDWFASAIKRSCRIKDFGALLPGHGGVLDRFDSALFSLPVTLMLALAWMSIR